MTDISNIDSKKKAKPVISDAGYPLPIELRPIWRIALMCLAISIVGSDNSLKLNKVRVFLWMLIRPKKWDGYYESLHAYNSSVFSMSSDKSTDVAIEIAIAKGFVKLESDSLVLDSEGYRLIDLISEIDIFKNEVEFVESIKNKVTDKYIKSLWGK
ncbi:hypothetical protein [Shewanella dokdonensis]|uniref:Uncharacterized protein n=1 Tax=Shewanella dokdonensis TaxID=712036 RepID=A0ABX8DBF1_9GAMM|nr:hypothetical protein [Shewanella dokdonensis]MCL1075488.1 hypothetical protein [Shewanella dokdonensis]QVK22163.1 hypothetical protein KHX94_12040 [Shewanella dokdonensis]